MGMSLWRIMSKLSLPRRQACAIMAVTLFLWGATVYNMNLTMTQSAGRSETESLKKEIVQLSEKYIRALARENEGVVDGPYAGRFTAYGMYTGQKEIVHLGEKYIRALARENEGVIGGPYAGRFTTYDLKKTMAVLLENVLERIQKIERTLYNKSTDTNITTVKTRKPALHAEDLINGKNEECQLTDKDKQLYPQCEGKIQWMKAMWKSDPCYASYGVDGSVCSFIMYLSEVEGWCPRRAWHGSNKQPLVTDLDQYPQANITSDMNNLMQLLVDPNERQGYAWIRMRIRRIWGRWVTAAKNLAKKQNFAGRKRKKILIHLGLLSKQSGWKFAEMQFKGGPLGELVQWSDLITTLYILGHQLTITSESEQLAEIIAKLPTANSPCQSRKALPVDIIYTDLVGLTQFKKKVKGGYGKFSCLLRIVDSFGTEPSFNLRNYAKSRKKLTSWGGQDLQPQQFFTMFPHSPDNSFMGFVVEQHLNESSASEIPRKDLALVYGKNDYMWKDKTGYLDVINKSLEIHGTVYVEQKDNTKPKLPDIPSYIQNHGILNGEDLHKLLRQAKIFIGLGFPYEGPAPLEAIGNGAVFLNPKFNPPHNRRNTKFFKGKPTDRDITSQHPYAEQFIGEPYVYTIDINNLDEVRTTVEKILESNKFQPYKPYEFTEEGMIQRMNAYLEHQNFCQFQKQPSKWPPESAIQILFGEAGKSCKDVCWAKNLICEPSHFLETNSLDSLKKYGAACGAQKSMNDIFYPALDTKTNDCLLQQEELLFSCVGTQENMRRLCPCRNYIKGQTALCQGCDR